MYGGFDSQIFLGNRDFYILDSEQDLNKPLIIRQNYTQNNQGRNPSQTEDNLIDSENVVGLMGDDEDIQQAQYNVMNMIDQRLDQFNGDIKDQLNKSINNRIDEIENMMTELNNNRITTFDEINELRRITEEQTGIMSNMGILINDDGLQRDMQRLDDLVFSQYQNMGESVKSNLSIASPPPPEERDEHYGKEKGETYYSSTPKIYDKYKEFPYYLNINDEWFKDKTAEQLKCEMSFDNNDGYCQNQPDNLYCVGNTSEETLRLFKKHENKESCTLKYDPDKNLYKCGDLEYQDSLYPLATIKDDFRGCMPPLFNNYYNDRYFTIIPISIFYLLLFFFMYSINDETFDSKSFILTIIITSVYFYLMFIDVGLKAPIYDYFYMVNFFDNKSVNKSWWIRFIFTFIFFPIFGVIIGHLLTYFIL